MNHDVCKRMKRNETALKLYFRCVIMASSFKIHDKYCKVSRFLESSACFSLMALTVRGVGN